MAEESSIQQYWRVYGGIWSLLRSTYFWLALFMSIVGVDLWWVSDEKMVPLWLPFSLNVTPSVLGFSLGGMAIFIGVFYRPVFIRYQARRKRKFLLHESDGKFFSFGSSASNQLNFESIYRA